MAWPHVHNGPGRLPDRNTPAALIPLRAGGASPLLGAQAEAELHVGAVGGPARHAAGLPLHRQNVSGGAHRSWEGGGTCAMSLVRSGCRARELTGTEGPRSSGARSPTCNRQRGVQALQQHLNVLLL